MQKKNAFLFFLTLFSFYTSYSQYELEEDFSSASFPPPGWTRGPNASNGLAAPIQPQWDRRSASAYGVGEGSAQVFFYDIAEGLIDSLTSPEFLPTIPNDSLYFDHAYRTTTPFMAVDELRIYTSDNGGETFNLFQTLLGGEDGDLNTESPDNSDYENPTIWASKKYPLPVGVNKIRFESFSAYGNNLFIDNIKVGKPLAVVPVTILSFTGNDVNNQIQIKWDIENEINNSEFDIEKLNGSSWRKLGTIKSYNNGFIKNEYTFNDKFPDDGYNYYRLKQTDINGGIKYSDVIKIAFNIKNIFVQNFPNPFTISTLIRYQVPAKTHVLLKIYDFQGKQIATLVNEIKDKGSFEVIWNSNIISAGIYLCRATIGDKNYIIKLNKIN